MSDVSREVDPNWTEFHFESNQAWGTCVNREQWIEVVQNYTKYWAKLNIAKSLQAHYGKGVTVDDNGSTNFGQRREHCGKYTLADFAKDHNMDLTTGIENCIDDPETSTFEDNRTKGSRK